MFAYPNLGLPTLAFGSASRKPAAPTPASRGRSRAAASPRLRGCEKQNHPDSPVTEAQIRQTVQAVIAKEPGNINEISQVAARLALCHRRWPTTAGSGIYSLDPSEWERPRRTSGRHDLP